jgi:photosystem II stability/assembly factor-like uncharacterized protein
MDGGNNWNSMNVGMPGIVTVVIDWRSPGTIYAGTTNGVFKSASSGYSWSAANKGLTSTYIRALGIDAQNPTTIYAGDVNGGGLFKSINGGSTWSSLDLDNLILSRWVYSLAVDPKNSGTVYAGTAGVGLFKSTNGGTSWSTINTGLPISAGASVSALAIDPQNPSILYASVAGAGVFKSSNGGGFWGAVNTGLPSVESLAALDLAIDPQKPATIYAASSNTSRGVFKSTNAGASWSAIATGLPSTGAFTKLAIDPQNPETVYAGSDGFGSLEITSDQPVSILALRLTINQRGDLLLTSTPVVDLTRSTPQATSLPQLADGGGYQTTFILMNTSDSQETGAVGFYGSDGAPIALRMLGASAAETRVSYTIPAGGFARFVTDGSSLSVTAGWAQVEPDAGSTAPASIGIFALSLRGVLVTEAGYAATQPTTFAKIYVDESGGHDTGLAVVNPGNSNIRITVSPLENPMASQEQQIRWEQWIWLP